MSDDLHGLVEHLGLGRFHLVATAAGGIGGLDYALLYPQQVCSLVVANSIGGVQDTVYLEVQQRLRPPEIQALPVELRELGPSTAASILRALAAGWQLSRLAARRRVMGRGSRYGSQ